MSSDEIIKIADYEVHLVKNKRAKHILLKQTVKGDIVLTCPRFCPKIMAIQFAKQQLPWIKAHVLCAPKQTVFKPSDTITLLGTSYILEQGALTKLCENKLIISGNAEFFHRRVCSYAKKILLSYVHQQVSLLTQKLGVKAGRITLRNTSSRWGSCSSKKTLSFCWKIAFAPQEVIDYLIAHEVAHLKEMNHSHQFWNVVDSLTDNRKNAEIWLKKNGRELQTIR